MGSKREAARSSFRSRIRDARFSTPSAVIDLGTDEVGQSPACSSVMRSEDNPKPPWGKQGQERQRSLIQPLGERCWTTPEQIGRAR